MQEVFEKIIKKMEEKIQKNCDDCQEEHNLRCHDVNFGIHEAIEIVKQAEAECRKENLFNMDDAILHDCPKCGAKAEHRVSIRGTWACGCFECNTFKSSLNHIKAIEEWEDYCKEYNNGWIPCGKMLAIPTNHYREIDWV